VDSDDRSTRQDSPAERYARACAAWHHALEHYLRLARQEASAARLKAAAAAVHAAAFYRSRLKVADEDHER
jgi:hypothetical protein